MRGLLPLFAFEGATRLRKLCFRGSPLDKPVRQHAPSEALIKFVNKILQNFPETTWTITISFVILNMKKHFIHHSVCISSAGCPAFIAAKTMKSWGRGCEMREQSARDDLDWMCLQKSKNIHINRIKDREIRSGHLLPAVIYLQKNEKILD